MSNNTYWGADGGNDFSGAGDWAYVGPMYAYDTYDLGNNDQLPPNWAHPLPPAHHAMPTYAEVVQASPSIHDAHGRHPAVRHTRTDGTRQLQTTVYQTRVPTQQLLPQGHSSYNVPNPYNINEQLQHPSWAQIAARANEQGHYANELHNTMATNVYGSHNLPPHYPPQARAMPQPYNTFNARTSQHEAGSSNALINSTHGNHAPMNQFDDFALYEDAMEMFLGQPQTFVERGSLNVNTTFVPDNTQLLRSPIDSFDTSSVASSTRRSKQVIMSGTSGDCKCRFQGCTAGFHRIEDQT